MGVTITEDESDKKFRQAKELSKEVPARHARDTGAAEELRMRSAQMDRTRLSNPDKKYAYRLANRTKDGERMALLQGLGYEVVPENDKTQLVMSAKKDGAQIQGDLALMRTPIENYEEGVAMRRARWAHMSGDRIIQAKENMNKIARDGGLVGPHKDAAE